MADGHEVFGVDNDEEALTLARVRGVLVVEDDMRKFRIRRRFARVLIPYNGIYCLLDDDDVVACFNCVRRHLKPGGQLLLDIYAGDAMDAGSADSIESAVEDYLGRVEAQGRRWDVFEGSDWSPVHPSRRRTPGRTQPASAPPSACWSTVA